LSAIQLFDLNGQERFSGTSVGGSGSHPDLAAVLAEGGNPDGNPITGPLDVDADSTSAFRVRNADATQDFVGVDTSTGIIVLAGQPATGRSRLIINPTAITFTDELGNTLIDLEAGYTLLGPAGTVYVNPQGYLVTVKHAAPADADLGSGECALWFDQTNGAAKLMAKGKTANGTVVSGSLALT
jgi:hypothetical protein